MMLRSLLRTLGSVLADGSIAIPPGAIADEDWSSLLPFKYSFLRVSAISEQVQNAGSVTVFSNRFPVSTTVYSN